MTCKRTKLSFQQRTDSRSNHHCCVPFCTASSRSNSHLSFHTFPKDSELQKQWVVKIRRDHFIITSTSRVCSRHFVTADLIEPPTPAGRRRLTPGAVPVLFHWNNYNIPTARPGVWERTERPPNTEPTEMPTDPDDPWPCHEHDYCASTEPAALDISLNENEELREEISRLRKQVEELTISSRFGLERFAASDEDIRFFTRFATHAHLMGLWKQIEPATFNIVRVTRAQTAVKTDQVPHSASATVLQPIDEFFLFMNYLSLGLMQKDLAHRFRIHRSTVSRIVNTWANFLYTVLGAVDIWLDGDTVKAHLPEVFQEYADTQVILDCTELRCQTPNSLLLQSEVFSTYKSHCTFKGLIGIAPHGAVTFVSSLYQGAISDKEILKQSGIVPLLDSSMAIMVDKGFLVEDCVPCRVHIPTFLAKRAQLSRSEIRQTQSIARLRVHVERVIRRVKEHKIFSTVIPLSITGSINQLFAVACLLVNYQNGPLVKAWASNC
ncbi:uncharacterized protein LOC125784831 [Astyanax mexicanus]|uniref:THAP-type domain-containing protein n=1 Tax=Astyanax mexicanus TaxID=7994 RepID=A0A8T2M7F2_ASTMX|nr:uncharacterized protein LOC125784831 [Astyanax mexicanus]KAG9279114.1 hypothetical protein AMEX_G4586 [Astyanax mexicanus]KAG9280506.1 hypothetical protein AMEX_G3226 [Astyanax mexicanus]